MLLRHVLRRQPSTFPKRWCGLVATLEFADDMRHGRTEAATVERAVARIAHRGPDGQGFVAGGDATRWALGHARLAIVAPNEGAAAQPFHLQLRGTNEEPRSIALAANGEIYTHKKLYADLQSRGTSHSDCEVIAHLYAELGPRETMRRLENSGMFAFVLVDDTNEDCEVFAARDPTGIKPLYYGTDARGRVVAFASELKAIVEVKGLRDVREFPNGHFFYDGHFVRYYEPEWQQRDDFCAEEEDDEERASACVFTALDDAVQKRMMTDVNFGLFLSGGVDSCIVGLLMAKRCRDVYGPSFRPPSFTVGMADSPDLMAARAMSRELRTEHYERVFTADEAIAVIEKVVYYLETYNAELIRSAVPNFFLAELASSHGVKMVLTGEGADELFAGYAYFRDAPSPEAVHRELCRIYSHLGVANLQRTDRMTMAHSLEARVPFLDVGHANAAFTRVSPSFKWTAGTKGPHGEPGEKRFLRRTFEREHGGTQIPRQLLYRAKAMQCEGVGEDWVALLQHALERRVSDAEFATAADRFPVETPHSKEEYYYRHLFDLYYPTCHHVPTLWKGGCRAAGAAWHSDTYTRAGLADVSRLTHAYQNKGGGHHHKALSGGGVVSSHAAAAL